MHEAELPEKSAGRHCPCVKCGSSDAGYIFPDGGSFCYKCHEHDVAPESVVVVNERPKRRKISDKAIPVEYIDLTKRGIRRDTCEKWRYGVGKLRGKTVQVAQYFDDSGSLCGQKIRTADKDFSIIGNLKPAGLYGKWLWRDSGKMLVIVEGEIDALTVSQLQGNKWPVVSVPNGAPSAKTAIAENIEWFEDFEAVVLMFDNDEEGNKAAIECAEILPPGKARIARLPLKDANEMLLAGRGKEVIDAIWGAKVYRPDEIVEGDEVLDLIYAADFEDGALWPHSGLNLRTTGMHPENGEVVAIVAGTGAGKSTFCREIEAALIKQKHKVGVIALEEPVRRASLGILSVFMSQKLHLKKNAELKTLGIDDVWNEIKDRVVFYNHFGSVAPKTLMSKVRYMVRAQGVRFIVLDHLSIVASGLDVEDDERRALDSTMTTISTMAQEMGVCIILVVHLRRKDGKPHEAGEEITLAHLRGSHGISQLAHTIVALERDQQADDSTETLVRLIKCRLTGETGVAGFLKYDRDTGRYTEAAMDFGDDDDAGEAGSEDL